MACAAFFPTAAVAGPGIPNCPLEDGLIYPHVYGSGEAEDLGEHLGPGTRMHQPPSFQWGYRIFTLSDGENGEIHLSTSDSGALRLEGNEREPLPPVSVNNGLFEFQVNAHRGGLRVPEVKHGFGADGGGAPEILPSARGFGDSTARLEDPPRSRPRALLTGLRVVQDQQSSSSGGMAKRLPEDRNGLTFSFAGSDPAACVTRFRYRLAGLNRDWIETEQRSVHYPNLQPGDYRFEVKAVSDAGFWSEPVGLSFSVSPPPSVPWWRQSPPMLILASVGVALAGSLYSASRTRRLLDLERLRISIAAGLHDQVGAGLTDIAILSEVAARKAVDLPELARVAATARELVDGLGDIVWLVNPRRDSLYELFLRLKDSYAELFACNGALLEVGDLSPFEGVHLPIEYRQDLHLLFKEALCNALRHSGCRRAELTVTLHGCQLAVVLRDDGRGFDPELRNRHGEGLENMQRRAGRLGGRLAIDSSPEGTVVRFAGSIS